MKSVLDTTTIALAHPIKTVTAIVSKEKTLADVKKEHFSQTIPEQLKDVVLGTAGLAATVIGAGAAGAAAKAGTLLPAAGAAAKSLIPSTAKGKVIAAVAAPVVIGAIAKEPVKTIEAAAKAPGELAQFGSDVATFVVHPGVETGKQVIKESPIISSIIAGAGIVAAGKAAAPIIGGALSREAVQEQTKTLESAILGAAPVAGEKIPGKTTTAPTAPQTPITPETKPLIATAGGGVSRTGTRAKKRTSKPVMQPIKQSVNVIVQNKASSAGIKNYLNRRVLLN